MAWQRPEYYCAYHPYPFFNFGDQFRQHGAIQQVMMQQPQVHAGGSVAPVESPPDPQPTSRPTPLPNDPPVSRSNRGRPPTPTASRPEQPQPLVPVRGPALEIVPASHALSCPPFPNYRPPFPEYRPPFPDYGPPFPGYQPPLPTCQPNFPDLPFIHFAPIILAGQNAVVAPPIAPIPAVVQANATATATPTANSNSEA